MSSKIHFLVVDDDVDVSSAISQILESNDFEVTISNSAETALNELRGLSIRPDIMLVDMLMPGMNGMAFLKEIRSMQSPWNHIPVVVSSAVTDQRVTQAASTYGLQGYLIKPWKIEELLRITTQCFNPTIELEDVKHFLNSARISDQTMFKAPAFKHLPQNETKFFPLTHKDEHFLLIALGESPSDIGRQDSKVWSKKIQIYVKRNNGSWNYLWPRLRDLP